MKIEDSSRMSEAVYNDMTRTLHVTFHGGRTYAYLNVPAHKWEGLQASESKGKFLQAEIIPHHRAHIVKT